MYIYIYTYRFSFTQTCGMDNIQFSNAWSRTFLYMKYQSTEYSQWRLGVLGVLSTSLPRPYMSANHLLNMECRKLYDIFIFITPWYKNLTGEICSTLDNLIIMFIDYFSCHYQFIENINITLDIYRKKRWYKAHQIPKLNCFSSRLAVVFAPFQWRQVLSREWRCSWSSADRRCSNYIWVIDNFIACQGASYTRDLTVNVHYIVHCSLSGWIWVCHTGCLPGMDILTAHSLTCTTIFLGKVV